MAEYANSTPNKMMLNKLPSTDPYESLPLKYMGVRYCPKENNLMYSVIFCLNEGRCAFLMGSASARSSVSLL